MRRRFSTMGCLVVLCLACNASRTQAEDRYFLLVFGSQGQPNLPRLAHTFATFIKATGDDNLKDAKLEAHTISWLPASLVVEPARLQPEVGKNLDLPATLAYAKANATFVSSWGPFAIKKELYDRALKQIEILNSGKIGYIALDWRFRGQGASNCIHAVCDLDTDKGLLDTGTAHGNPASLEVVRHLERWTMPTKEDLGILYERLAIPKEVERVALTQSVTAR